MPQDAHRDARVADGFGLVGCWNSPRRMAEGVAREEFSSSNSAPAARSTRMPPVAATAYSSASSGNLTGSSHWLAKLYARSATSIMVIGSRQERR
jgi:hypothetical protein